MAFTYDNGSKAFTADYSEHYAMIEKFAKQFIFNVQSANPLQWIDKGVVDNGVAIEEAMVKLLDSSEWISESQDGSNLNAPNYPEILVQYFSTWNGKQFKTTVSEDQIRKVLLSGGDDMDVARMIVASLTESEGHEDYKESKGLLLSAIQAKNILAYGGDTPTVVDVSSNLIIQIKNMTDEFQFVNNSYLGYAKANPSANYQTRTPFNRIRIIMPYTVYNKMNVDVLASLYNLEKAELLSRISLIDEGTKVFVIDEMGLGKWRRLYKMTSKYVEDALYSNYWLTLSRMYTSCNLFKMGYIETSAEGNTTSL